MQPHIEINYLAVIVAAAAQFAVGWLWHGPLFGKLWAKEMNMSMENMPDKSVMVRGMTLSIVGSLLIVYILAHSALVWRPSVWGVGADQADHVYGFFAAFFTWVGFFVPQALSAVAWEGRSWKLFGINTGYHFVSLQVAGMILAYWR